MTTTDPGAAPDPGPASRQADRLLTKDQVAQILGGNVTGATIIRRHRHWGLTGHRVGREIRFWESDVYQWIASR
jgi:predicted DNA-binding transcriptional regulator AlpA